MSTPEGYRAGKPTWGRAGERPGAPRARDEMARQGIIPRDPDPQTTARGITGWVDATIAQAQRRGAFDDLPGAGKPLPEVDARADPDWWVKGLIERERLDLSEALPGPMQLRREKAQLLPALMEESDEQVVRSRLVDFNERVLADRRRPAVGPFSPPVVGRVDVEAFLDDWRAHRRGP